MNIPINIFLLCYNEKEIIGETIKHYKTLFPACKITILDNMSNDGSPMIARQLGCTIKQFNTGGNFDDYKHKHLRNECWKHIRNEWIIVCDMDEWLCITNDELIQEDMKGTTILTVKGYEIIGDSKVENLSDINLHHLKMGIISESENKPICFKAGHIREMMFEIGGHRAFPEGRVNWSEQSYILKHMNYLGLPFKLMRQKLRFERSHKARAQYGLCMGYSHPLENFINNHDNLLNSREDLTELLKNYNI
jgi:glycosyltransferase involved in cell wall biosynthesis